eukprot:CAMPEP_0172512238 /NCGR_PEP_ID=MMETSP1066-20121228/242783_1 /TAXON_ID=671091 /ORGANISM="Coscinodiscus wailesii, Strain CCMP2513" /LENGTH=54 /DNA_ID=CAMNT_0013291955 /DNA_START=37 /DNA_END=201 /DNA_ORIENTATION=+
MVMIYGNAAYLDHNDDYMLTNDIAAAVTVDHMVKNTADNNVATTVPPYNTTSLQ